MMKLVLLCLAVMAAGNAMEFEPRISGGDAVSELEQDVEGQPEVPRESTDMLTSLEAEELLIPSDVESFVDELVEEMKIVEDFGEGKRVQDEIAEGLLSSVDREDRLRPGAPRGKGENGKNAPQLSNACRKVCYQYNGGIRYDCKRFLNDRRHRYYWKRRQLTIHCFRCQRDCMLASFLDFMP